MRVGTFSVPGEAQLCADLALIVPCLQAILGLTFWIHVAS